MIKALFFDNDGILVSTEHLYAQANQIVLEALGHEFDLERYQTDTLNRGLGIQDYLAELEYDEDAIHQQRLQRDQHYFDLVASGQHAIPGALETVAKLSAQFPLWIVTASRRDHFDVIHQNTGFLPHFQGFFTREDYAKSKPHPDGYLLALQHSGIKPGEALVIEDSPRGIAAAKTAGIRAVAIPHGPTLELDFAQADHVLHNIKELPNLIAQLNGTA